MPKGEEHFWYSVKMRRGLARCQDQEPRRPRLWTWSEEGRVLLRHDPPEERP